MLMILAKLSSQIFIVCPQIANQQIRGLFPQLKSAKFSGLPVRKSQIRNFLMLNLQIANLQISQVQFENRKSANLQGKKQCF
jgi:hypothetical protein